MSETMVTVVGNVATAPVFRELPSGSVARFRLAATARHRDRSTGEWADGHTNFFTVWAWRGLGTNVAASLSVGDPVIVQGRLKVRNEERAGGRQWMSADVDAVVVGHDLARGTSAFRRAPRMDRTPGAQHSSGAAQQSPWGDSGGSLTAAEVSVPTEEGSLASDRSAAHGNSARTENLAQNESAVAKRHENPLFVGT